MATQATGRRNRRTSSLFLVAIIVIAAVVTFATYAAASGASTLTISAPSTDSGFKADVFSVASTFSGVQGQGKKTFGVVLSKLTFGTPGDSDDVRIEFLWTDPDQAAGVLRNPNAVLETRVYYVSTDCPTADQRTFEDGVTVTVCPDPDEERNFKALSISNTGAYFIPTILGQSVLYILADITVPGGAPAGQQSSLTELTFIIGVS